MHPVVRRGPADGGDDDDAIAYAWFNEDGSEVAKMKE